MPLPLPPAGTFSNPALKEGEFKTALEQQLAALGEAQTELAAGDVATLVAQIATLQTKVTALEAAAAVLGPGTARFSTHPTTPADACVLGGGAIPLLVGGAWKMRTIPPNNSVSISRTDPALLPLTSVRYIYAYDQAGVTKLEGSATGHGPEASAGIRVKTGDATRTLVGMVRLGGTGNFDDQFNVRCVISFFNRRNLFLQSSAAGANSTTASASAVEANATHRTYFLSWGDEAQLVSAVTFGNQTTLGCRCDAYIGMDGAVVSAPFGWQAYANGVSTSIHPRHVHTPTEGFHFYNVHFNQAGGGTAMLFDGYPVYSVIRG
jgi:hypothetical protein